MLRATVGALVRTPTRRTAAASLAQRGFASSASWEKQRLVILGSGWGGYETLRKVDKSRYDVTVVSPTSHFAFTPLLAGCAVGTIEYECAIEPVRAYNTVKYYQAWADQIDLRRNRITCMSAVGAASTTEEMRSLPGSSKTFEVGYDKLVIAVGCYSQTFNTPGVKQYANFLKETKDARKIRSRILECFELAAQPTLTDVERRNLLNFVIVGGGPTGVEFAGELSDFITSDLERAFPTLAPLARITIYDVAPGILGSFDKSLQEYAEKKFDREGIKVKGNHHVKEVKEDHLVIEEEGRVDFGLLVWSTGLAPNPLIDSIQDLQHDEKTHSLKVTDTFNPINVDGTVQDNVFVIGDASSLEAKLPATAQVASQEASFLAKHLNKLARGKKIDPDAGFVFNNAGVMSYLGGWDSVVDRSQADKGPKGELTGKAAWLLWRSAYWSQAMSIRNKMLLAFYWFMTWLSGRRITKV
ncbi:uncharacterized protein JCM15063_004609 [Sporobolomyces koalae]|uniref:uncharacterized protein n=1 Tax=Sporobolomyces koalae TaxID=500713 RepID=UPI00317A2C68